MKPHRVCAYCGSRCSFDAAVHDRARGLLGMIVEVDACPECAKKRRNPKSYGSAGTIRPMTHLGFRRWLASEKGIAWRKWKQLGPERYFPSPRSFFLARVVAIEVTTLRRPLGAVSADAALEQTQWRYLLGSHYYGKPLKPRGPLGRARG